MSRSFKSYVDLGKEDNLTTQNASQSSSDVFQPELEPTLLPGEAIICTLSSVQKFNTYCERKQGKLGTLYCTNFRLAYISVDKSPYNKNDLPEPRNLLLGDDDIALTNIDTLTQITKGRRRILPPCSKFSDRVKTLEVCCKNFSVLTFGFKLCNRHGEKKFINTLLHHAYPQRIELQFAFDYQLDQAPTVKEDTSSPPFSSYEDYKAELDRMKASNYWRVTRCNERYELSISLPPYFVILKQLVDSEFMRIASQYQDDHAPTWCYSVPNGSSLIRMSTIRTDQVEVETRMLDLIKSAHPKKREPVVVNIAEKCPTVKELSASYEKFKSLCIPVESLKDFWSIDTGWNVALDNTLWHSYVLAILQTVVNAANTLTKQATSVILKEHDDRDFSCAVASLVLILLDPQFRTMKGFQSLIQREWVMMAHRFSSRFRSTSEQCPVFLLFLDCVWQMLQQRPAAFEFSETYLTCLWDSMHMGIFGTFLFDSPKECQTLTKINPFDKDRKTLLSVWDWDKQFTANEQTLFMNPLYVAKKQLLCNDSPTANGEVSHLDSYAVPTGSINADGEKRVPLGKYSEMKQSVEGSTCHSDDKDMLTIVVSAPKIKLWEQCYLRWATPIEIIGGGAPCQYLQQCVIVKEVQCLEQKLQTLQPNTPTSTKKRESYLFFSLHDPSTRQKTDILTSSFPFSPGGTPTVKTVGGTPLSLYVEKSDFNFYEGDDKDD